MTMSEKPTTDAPRAVVLAAPSYRAEIARTAAAAGWVIVHREDQPEALNDRLRVRLLRCEVLVATSLAFLFGRPVPGAEIVRRLHSIYVAPAGLLLPHEVEVLRWLLADCSAAWIARHGKLVIAGQAVSRHPGRPRGSILSAPSLVARHPDLVALLRDGDCLTDAAASRATGACRRTVARVRAALAGHASPPDYLCES